MKDRAGAAVSRLWAAGPARQGRLGVLAGAHVQWYLRGALEGLAHCPGGPVATASLGGPGGPVDGVQGGMFPVAGVGGVHGGPVLEVDGEWTPGQTTGGGSESPESRTRAPEPGQQRAAAGRLG